MLSFPFSGEPRSYVTAVKPPLPMRGILRDEDGRILTRISCMKVMESSMETLKPIFPPCPSEIMKEARSRHNKNRRGSKMLMM